MRNEEAVQAAYDGLGTMIARLEEHEKDAGPVDRRSVGVVRAMRLALGWVLGVVTDEPHIAHGYKSLETAKEITNVRGEVEIPKPILPTMRDECEIHELRRAMKVLTQEAIENGCGEDRATVLFIGIEAGARWAAGMSPEDDADEAIEARIAEGIGLAKLLVKTKAEAAAAEAETKGGEGSDDW